MKKGITESGFEFEIDERIINDWRVISAITDTMAEDDTQKLLGAKRLANLLLGSDGEAKLIEHIADKNDGFVPVPVFMGTITEILNKLKSKN